MARKNIHPLQESFDLLFDTEEEKQVAQHNETITTIIDDLVVAPAAELAEIVAITNPYKPIILDNDINDGSFSTAQWIYDNLTAIKIANRGCNRKPDFFPANRFN